MGRRGGRSTWPSGDDDDDVDVGRFTATAAIHSRAAGTLFRVSSFPVSWRVARTHTFPHPRLQLNLFFCSLLFMTYSTPLCH